MQSRYIGRNHHIGAEEKRKILWRGLRRKKMMMMMIHSRVWHGTDVIYYWRWMVEESGAPTV